jgi:hypothetical protein
MSSSPNEAYVAEQIRLKTSPRVYLSSPRTVEECVNDMDHFPYTRFYRGRYQSSEPVVWRREAGYHPLCPAWYTKDIPTALSVEPTWDMVYQPPCSTVFPRRAAVPKQVQEYTVWSSP